MRSDCSGAAVSKGQRMEQRSKQSSVGHMTYKTNLTNETQSRERERERANERGSERKREQESRNHWSFVCNLSLLSEISSTS